MTPYDDDPGDAGVGGSITEMLVEAETLRAQAQTRLDAATLLLARAQHALDAAKQANAEAARCNAEVKQAHAEARMLQARAAQLEDAAFARLEALPTTVRE